MQPSVYGPNTETTSIQPPGINGYMPQAVPNPFDTLNPFASEETTEPLSGGIDLNFMLNGGLNKNQGGNASTSADDPYSHGESLLNFLFSNSSDD